MAKNIGLIKFLITRDSFQATNKLKTSQKNVILAHEEL